MKKRNKKGLISFEDISSSAFEASHYGLQQDELMGAIHAMTPAGNIIKGVPVFIQAYELLGLGWLVKPLQWPIIRSLANVAYRFFAQHRIFLGRFFTGSSCKNFCSFKKR